MKPFLSTRYAYAHTIDNFVAAISNASTSAVNLANAFFDPSGLVQLSVILSPSSSTPKIYTPYQSIDLDCVHVIQLLQCLLDLPLVRLHIHDENQRIVFFNLLHRTLRVQRVNDHFVVVEARLMGY